MSRLTKEDFTLVYFKGCQTADQAKDLLREAGVRFAEVCQDDLPLGHEMRNFASPTLLKGKEIVFGVELNPGSGACSLKIPTERELLGKLYPDQS